MHWKKELRNRRGFTLIELLVVIVIIGILAAIALPNYIKVKEKAKEAEVKANLHNIQLATERFAVDSEGAYPQYLIGGEAKYAGNVYLGSAANAFTDVQECDPLEGVSDVLLRRGYVGSYPRNPFVRTGIAIHQVQTNLPSSINGDDPLRNDFEDGRDLGTRFGPYCTTMGSVLADPRYQEWLYVNPTNGTQDPRYTWCNIEYEFWDMWVGNKPLPYLPGQFFYKGVGPIMATGEMGSGGPDSTPGGAGYNEIVTPIEVDQYVLGGFGGIRSKGKDVLGDERPFAYFMRADAGNHWLSSATWAGGNPAPGTVPAQANQGDPDPYNGGSFPVTEMYIWPWTRSEIGGEEEIGGSPYLPANIGDSNEQLKYGNSNGIRDGVILMLTAGEDYAPDR